MKIIATLQKPYTENERMNFIVEQNHNNGYEIQETETELQALGYTDEEKEQAERKRLDNLSMTRGDVFEAMILAKGLGKAQLRAMIEQAPLDDLTKALYLNRFDEALDFYRAFPAFDLLGQTLNITGGMLDKFFDTKDYHYLTTCKLTINPTPENATVTIVPDPTPYGDIAHYKVECEGYLTVEGDIEMVKDEVLEIVLNEDTTDTEQPADNGDEVEAEETSV